MGLTATRIDVSRASPALQLGVAVPVSKTGEKEGFVYQELCELPCFDGNYALIGSWVIGQEAAGIGIRESNSLITDNGSRFVPHIIV